MGESDDDIINLALTLRAMDIESIPVNFLHSIPKTPFETKKQLIPAKMLEDALPVPLRQSEQRDSRRRQRNKPALAAAIESVSREFNLRERLSYDTGQEASDAHRMIEDLGFELDQPAAI